MATLAALAGQRLPENAGPDSMDKLQALLGKSQKGRDYIIEHSASGVLSIIKDGWKYIEPSNKPRMNKNTNIELGNDPKPQLYHLVNDIGEQTNLAVDYPEKVTELTALLEKVRKSPMTRL